MPGGKKARYCCCFSFDVFVAEYFLFLHGVGYVCTVCSSILGMRGSFYEFFGLSFGGMGGGRIV